VAKAERLEQLADRALVVRHPEARQDEPLQVDPPPAHHAMHGPVGAGLDKLRDLGALLLRQTRLGTLGPTVQKALGTLCIEPVNPVAQRLPVHSADPGRLRPAHAVHNRSQRQQPTALVCVLRPRRQAPKLGRRIVLPKLYR
jgi:hypothetical protein